MKRQIGAVLCGCVFLAAGASVPGQGVLQPSGAPGPTMKTLDQIAPRTPITNLPWTITTPGSYYVTTNLASAGDGIIVRSSNVTVDLMGFRLQGDMGASDYGIRLDGDGSALLENVVVRNGVVAQFGDGVNAEYVQNSRLERLGLQGNSGNGISISDVFIGNTMEDCTIGGNGTVGLDFAGLDGQCRQNRIAHCVISSNAWGGVSLSAQGGRCTGNTISDCSILANGDDGIVLCGSSSGEAAGNTIADCTILGNTGPGVCLDASSSGLCNGNAIRGCAIAHNGSGIILNGSSGVRCNDNTIRECTIHENTSYGIALYGDTSGHCHGNTVADSTISGSGVCGVYLIGTSSGACNGNTIVDCVISSNQNYGVWLLGTSGQCWGNAVLRCRVAATAGTGIETYSGIGNRIEANHVSGEAGYGIRTVASADDVIVRNTCMGCSTNYDLTTYDVFGPIVTNKGELDVTGRTAHAWANFSY